MTETATATRPRILADDETVDALDTFPVVMVKARDLKPGMLLLDAELGTAVAAIDHRNRAPQGSGAAVWFVEVLDAAFMGARGYTEVVTHANALLPVAGA